MFRFCHSTFAVYGLTVRSVFLPELLCLHVNDTINLSRKKYPMRSTVNTLYIQNVAEFKGKSFRFRINIGLFNLGKHSQCRVLIGSNFTSNVQSCVRM